MRSHRMRGYGAWCQGWNDAARSRRSGPPPSDNGGCLAIMICLGAVFIFSCIKVTLETGNIYALFIGMAVIAGVLKGLKS